MADIDDCPQEWQEALVLALVDEALTMDAVELAFVLIEAMTDEELAAYVRVVQIKAGITASACH